MWELIYTLVGALGGAFITLVVQRAQAVYQLGQHRYEQLTGRYSDLVRVASAEITRLEYLSFLVNHYSGDPGRARRMESRLERQRGKHRGELARLDLQIRILETDEELRSKVSDLAKSQPAILFALPPQRDDDYYQKRAREFDEAIVEFKNKVADLAERVARRNSRAWRQLP